MLDYSTKLKDKYLRELKEHNDQEENLDEIALNRVLEKYEGTTDYICKYAVLNDLFESCGKRALYFENDIGKFKGYFYLAAKAGDICLRLYEKGFTTRGPISDMYLEDRSVALRFAAYAILADREDLALSITLKDSLLGAVLMEDYEKAKKYLPEDIKAISKNEDFDLIMWSVIYNDEKLFQKNVERLIKSGRNCEKRLGVVNSYMHVIILAIIKLARKRGISCNLNVIELPMQVLDDATPINEAEWQLPADEKLAEILGA